MTRRLRLAAVAAGALLLLLLVSQIVYRSRPQQATITPRPALATPAALSNKSMVVQVLRHDCFLGVNFDFTITAENVAHESTIDVYATTAMSSQPNVTVDRFSLGVDSANPSAQANKFDHTLRTEGYLEPYNIHLIVTPQGQPPILLDFQCPSTGNI
jgi:hypothetical protein